MSKGKLRNPEFWLLSEEAAAAQWRAEAALSEWAAELARYKRDQVRRRSEARRQDGRRIGEERNE